MHECSGNVNLEKLGHFRRDTCATEVRKVRKAFRISEEILWNAAILRKVEDIWWLYIYTGVQA